MMLKQRKLLNQNITLKESAALSSYLTDLSNDEILLSKAMWRGLASRKEMVESSGDYTMENLQYFQRIAKAGKKTFYRKVPYSSVKIDVTRFATAVRKQHRTNASELVAGKITGQEWYEQTLFLTRASHYASFIVEEGGVSTFQTQERLDRWITVTIPIFLSLNRVALQLTEGKRELNGRLLLDADMVAENIITSFENWRLNWAIGHNVHRARRRLQGPESCHDSNDRKGCVELAAKGYVNTWAMVPIGMAACYHKCRCIVEYTDELE